MGYFSDVIEVFCACKQHKAISKVKEKVLHFFEVICLFNRF